MSESTDLAPEMIQIVHKETGMTSVVHESTVPGWETAGWTRADNGSEEPDRNQPFRSLSSTETLGDDDPDDETQE